MERNVKFAKIAAVALALLLCFAMAACDFDESKNNFNGGELLDESMLESIKDSFATTEIGDDDLDPSTESTVQTDFENDETVQRHG